MHAIFFQEPIESNFVGHQFAEIYKDRVYAPLLEGKKDLTILDIGANIGLTSYYFSKFAKNVYALEPSVEQFDAMLKMIEYNKITNIHPISKAIYIKSGTFPGFKVEDNKTMNSLHQAVVRDPQNPVSEPWECITLAQLFADFSIDHIDIAKIDIEGTETELICSTSFKEVANKIDTVITEQHAWSGRHPNQLLEGFKNSGFKNIHTVPSDANIIVATK